MAFVVVLTVVKQVVNFVVVLMVMVAILLEILIGCAVINGISNHTKSYYWAKHGKPNYMHQVI